MANQCCPTCGRALPKPKASAPPADLSAMTTAERFAYFKKTAPVEDVRFALRAGVKMSPALRDDWQALLGLAPTLARGETYRRLTALQARWRIEDNARPIPAIGTPAWSRRQDRIKARQVAERAQMEYLAPIQTKPGQYDRTSGQWTKPIGPYRGRRDARRLVA